MIKPSRRTRDLGDAVVRRTTMIVAAACLVGTGAVAAIQAKAYGDRSSSGGTKATGSEGLSSQTIVTSYDSHGDDHDDHEQDDDHDDDHDDHEEDDHRGSFSQPATAPSASSGSAGLVVSGGS